MEPIKLHIGILCGGRSAEHEISLISAKSVIEALDKDKYEIHIIGIDKNGAWHLRDSTHFLNHAEDPKLVHLGGEKQSVALIPREMRKEIVSFANNQLSSALKLDVIFPILHGPYGEDGTVQGLLKMAQVPFVGAGVLGSAIGMDKDVMKRLLLQAGMPVARYRSVNAHHKDKVLFSDVVDELGLPFFIKPANLGSSVGISKVKSEAEFLPSLNKAFHFDRKVIIEEFIQGREIECSVLGNEHPIASLPGELIPTHEFYSYEAKYVDPEGAHFKIPVELPQEIILKIQRMAIEAFQTLCCEGMARVDFFLKESGELFINEMNTIPGFTKISMYPKLWEASGMPYTELLDRLIELAVDRFEKDKQLQTAMI
jgi:D-alanine-D-alanine ligase